MRISRKSGSIVAGPRMQLRPTTSAPASARRWQASATVQSSRVTSALCIASVITAVLLRLLDDVERDQRLLRPRERLADDEVDAGVDRPADLLLEHRAHGLVRRGIRRVVDVGVADVAGEERAGLRRDGLRDLERPAVDRLQILLAADHAKLLAMRVVGERLDDVGARVDEIAMELRDDLGMLEHDLGHERAGLQIAAALELEHVAFGADHGPLVEALQQGEARRSRTFMAERIPDGIEGRRISHVCACAASVFPAQPERRVCAGLG